MIKTGIEGMQERGKQDSLVTGIEGIRETGIGELEGTGKKSNQETWIEVSREIGIDEMRGIGTERIQESGIVVTGSTGVGGRERRLMGAETKSAERDGTCMRRGVSRRCTVAVERIHRCGGVHTLFSARAHRKIRQPKCHTDR